MLHTILLTALISFPAVKPLPPTYGFPNLTLGKGEIAFRAFYMKPLYTTKYQAGQGMMKFPKGMSYAKDILMMKLRYGLSSKTTILFNLPFVFSRLETTALLKKGRGVGDIKLGALTRLVRKRSWASTGIAGLILPTGKAKHLKRDELPRGKGNYGGMFAFTTGGPVGHFYSRLSGCYTYYGGNTDDYIWGTATLLCPTPSPKMVLELSLLGKREVEGQLPDHFLKLFGTLHYIVGKGKVLQFALVRSLTQRQKFGANWEVWAQTYLRIPLTKTR